VNDKNRHSFLASHAAVEEDVEAIVACVGKPDLGDVDLGEKLDGDDAAVGFGDLTVEIGAEKLLAVGVDEDGLYPPIGSGFGYVELDLDADKEGRMVDGEAGDPDVVEDAEHAVTLVFELTRIFAELREQKFHGARVPGLIGAIMKAC